MNFPQVGVVGAGAMGQGIAQVSVQAGSTVLLQDARAGAALAAIEAIEAQWRNMSEKGRATSEQTSQWRKALQVADDISELAQCTLVIEAIVEDRHAKHVLFEQLESVVAVDAVLASNTSSLSITELACGLRQPGRFCGFQKINAILLAESASAYYFCLLRITIPLKNPEALDRYFLCNPSMSPY